MFKKLVKFIRRLILLILVAIAVFVTLIFVFDFITEKVVHIKKVITVPDLKGKELIEAIRILKKNKLKLHLEKEQYESKVAPGCIISQSPTTGTIVRAGKVIKVISSKGGERIIMPSVLGRLRRVAEITLRKSGLVIGQEKEKYSLIYKKNEVMEQVPVFEKEVVKKSIVNLVVSIGLPPNNITLMQNFIGKKIEDVQREIDEVEYIRRLNVEYVYNENFKSTGTVVGQRPEPDSVIKRKKVNLTVTVNQS